MGQTGHPAKRIKFILQQHSLSLQTLSKLLGIGEESLREILDEKEMPTPSFLCRLSRLFHLNSNFFRESLEAEHGSVTVGCKADPIESSLRSEESLEDQPDGASSRKRKSERKLSLPELASRRRAFYDLMVAMKTRRCQKEHD